MSSEGHEYWAASGESLCQFSAYYKAEMSTRYYVVIDRNYIVKVKDRIIDILRRKLAVCRYDYLSVKAKFSGGP